MPHTPRAFKPVNDARIPEEACWGHFEEPATPSPQPPTVEQCALLVQWMRVEHTKKHGTPPSAGLLLSYLHILAAPLAPSPSCSTPDSELAALARIESDPPIGARSGVALSPFPFGA